MTAEEETSRDEENSPENSLTSELAEIKNDADSAKAEPGPDSKEHNSEQFTPQPETPQFATELNEPAYMTQNEITFGVFRLNRDNEQDGISPVVINLGIGEKAQSGEGRAALNAFAQTIKRPIVVIDMPGLGASSDVSASKLAKLTFDSLGNNYLEILNELGVDKFDAVGLSTGGVLASKIAERAGDRAEHLVTFSTPSFEKKTATEFLHNARKKNRPAYKDAVANAPASVQEEIKAVSQNRSDAHAELSTGAKTKSLLATMKYARLLRDATMSGL